MYGGIYFTHIDCFKCIDGGKSSIVTVTLYNRKIRIFFFFFLHVNGPHLVTCSGCVAGHVTQVRHKSDWSVNTASQAAALIW